jgi:polyribonucleotide nucleotidyltransferase
VTSEKCRCVGTIIIGKVTKIVDFGAFVSIGGNKEGLVHISDIAEHMVDSVSTVLKYGQDVKVIGDDEKGTIKLSMKDV